MLAGPVLNYAGLSLKSWLSLSRLLTTESCLNTESYGTICYDWLIGRCPVVDIVNGRIIHPSIHSSSIDPSYHCCCLIHHDDVNMILTLTSSAMMRHLCLFQMRVWIICTGTECTSQQFSLSDCPFHVHVCLPAAAPTDTELSSLTFFTRVPTKCEDHTNNCAFNFPRLPLFSSVQHVAFRWTTTSTKWPSMARQHDEALPLWDLVWISGFKFNGVKFNYFNCVKRVSV